MTAESALGTGFQLATPLLGAGVAAALVAAAAWLSRSPRVERRRGARLLLRVLTALALGLAAASPSARGPARPLRVELLDASASFRPRRPAAEGLLREARTAALAEGIETRRLPFADGVGESASADGTDLAGAIGAALAAGATEVLLVSDGVATTGGALEAAGRAAARGVPVHAALPSVSPGPSLAIESIRVPERVRAGAAFEVEVGVLSSGAGPLEARVTAQDRSVAVALPGGEARASAVLSLFAPTTPGLARLDVRLEPRLDEDQVPEDERARPAVLVVPPSRILLVAPADAQVPAGPLAMLLEGAERRLPQDMAAEAAALAGYDGAVLLEAGADALGASAMEALARFVESGGGLLAAGDRRAFGEGKYAGTPLERVLPVLSSPKRPGEMLALAIALDRSGSMGEDAGTGTGTSKRGAALAALRGPLALLSPGDVVAGITFTRGFEVVRPAGPLGDPGALVAALGAGPTEGNTDIFPALRAAIEAVRAIPAARRHVLLLSDGRSEATPGPSARALADLEVPAEVTISVVSVGRDADAALLGAIAAKGRGRFADAAAGTKALEAALSREVDPRRLPPTAEGPIALPGGGALRRMARVEARPLARTLLAAPEVGPLLVEGEAGAGRAVAYASSDLAPRAAEVAAALERAARPAAAPGYSLSLVEEGGLLRIEASAPTVTTLAARISGREEVVLLPEDAPRLHRARIPLPADPVVVSLVPQAQGASPAGPARALATAVHAPARPLEHVPAPPDEDLLRAIAASSGGRYVGPGERLPPPLPAPAGGRRPLSHAACLIAAALLALDLALAVLLGRPA